MLRGVTVLSNNRRSRSIVIIVLGDSRNHSKPRQTMSDHAKAKPVYLERKLLDRTLIAYARSDKQNTSLTAHWKTIKQSRQEEPHGSARILNPIAFHHIPEHSAAFHLHSIASFQRSFNSLQDLSKGRAIAMITRQISLKECSLAG